MSAEIAHWIDGRNVAGGGPAHRSTNPFTGDTVATFRAADAQDVAAAVAAARNAFAGPWPRASVPARQKTLRAIAATIRGAADALADLQVAETGLLRTGALRQIEAGAAWFDHYADTIATEAGAAYRQLPGATTLVTRTPIGVCALFTPWNVPVALAAIKLAPALAAGNTVVWKPSEEVPATSRLLADLLTGADLPPGVLNLVNGPGAITGAALAKAPIDALSFTGGSAGGQAVAAAAAPRNIPITLELGGKSASIVFADADQDAALDGVLSAAYGNNGEACLAGSRILVEAAIFEAFTEAFAARAKSLKVGDPAAPDTRLGPMVSAHHAAHVSSFFGTAARDGDALICGGTADGTFIAPSAYTVASTQSRL
ncbi:MAG: aldehyde dehydrogenase family protein, partial [Pseudomonadota bacterium]